MNVEQHCPGSVAYIGDVHLSARKIPDQPAVNRAETKFSGLGLLSCPKYILKNPADLGGAEVCVHDKSGLFPDEIREPFCLEAVAKLGSPPVLPYDGIIDRLTSLSIPYDGGFSLVGDAYSGNIKPVYAQCGDCLRHYGCLGAPDVLRIMFYPARFREMLWKFFL